MLTRNSVSQHPPGRRSARLLDPKTPINSKHSNSKENTARSMVKISEKPEQSSDGSTNCASSTSRLRRSQRFNTESSKLPADCVNSTSGVRESPRLNSGSSSNKSEGSKSVQTTKVESRKNKSIKGEPLDENKRGMEKKKRAISVESERRDVSENAEDAEVKRKRKRERKPKDGGDAVVQGWTREQELALQRAYFAAKPTPNFWKKVSKLVPGKSAQDCFDRIHTNHLTPTPPKPRSRAKRKNLSPIEHLSFSASKLLQSSPPRSKSLDRGKHESHLERKKTVRHLLRKHHLVDEDDGVDLFSILEPGTSPSMHVLPNVMSSTPKNLGKQGFLQKCNERSSSGCKKHRSRLGNSCTGDLVSPPVLKQIKNRALHEKYIDQLHNREAKRKSESALAEQEVAGKENSGTVQIQIDKVKAAKNALVSDAREVITLLQRLQTTSVDNNLDMDDDDDGDCDADADADDNDINL
ncbi:hypothetical protein HRI_000392100 [Hibiscus trionum]|uniref:Myb-like domain-containing protein n=1 Tax=Hibiscus trionum TaxID=183268 RepID=A0A9W7GXZ2_HIBTR|nr:hypothetical protein HRI_000392100 [Hibiscus trionum]